MTTLQIEHGVRNYDAWKAAFDGDPVGREAGGVRRYTISRPSDDPAYVIVDLEFDTLEEAEGFREKLRGLWASAGADLGLESPRARILDVVETRDY
jgi:hypothetical protein